jgi:hypothetical protein
MWSCDTSRVIRYVVKRQFDWHDRILETKGLSMTNTRGIDGRACVT